jgi:hypothetical protein
MRKEKDLMNVHQRALKAAERVEASRPLQGFGQLAEPSVWHKVKEILPSSEVLDVTGRMVKGFVIPHWAAGVLLAAILTGMGFMYSRMSDQRDMLIRLDTQLQERDRHELEYRQEFKNALAVQKVYIDNMTTQLNIVRTLLSPEQRRQLERSIRKDEN